MDTYNNIINGLENIGNKFIFNSKKDDAWDIKQYYFSNPGIGWISFPGESFELLKSPFDILSSKEYKCEHKYTKDRQIDNLIVSKMIKKDLTYVFDRQINIKYKGNTYKVSHPTDGVTVNTKADDGTVLYYNSKDKAYYFQKYSETFEIVAYNSSQGIPFYCWYIKDEDIYVGVQLKLTAEDDSKDIIYDYGWVLVYSDKKNYSWIIRIKENMNDNSAEADSTPPAEDPPSPPQVEWEGSNAYELEGDYREALSAADSELAMKYWNSLYGENNTFSMKSHNSIIGLPMQFLPNVDMRIGSSTYGKQFMEDILYDMSIACIKPGGPVLNPAIDDSIEYSDSSFEDNLAKIGKLGAYFSSIKEYGLGDTLKKYVFNLFKGGASRFYSFQSDYTHYTHYVNTLCHLFITYLGLGDQEYTTANGITKKYINYSDDITEIETDDGLTLGHQFGWDSTIYVYYSPESSLNHTFSNSTTESGLTATIQQASSAVKEYGFFANMAGIETGKGIIDFTDLAANMPSTGFLSRLFSRTSEGVSTILAGNNLSLPEIYSDSETAVRHDFKIKLASPYGDRESVFLYVLRPLARLLAFSLPRQYGPNSYYAPFIVQAFSKGQFNCQLGIVENLSITRCGNGGESHTINHIPTELEINLSIVDMYEKVFLSNEFRGNKSWKAVLGGVMDLFTGGLDNVGNGAGTMLMQSGMTLTATRLLFNNVGLIDFVASFAGFNLNMPSDMDGWTLIYNIMKNRSAEVFTYRENDGWKFPKWEKVMNDAFNDAATKLSTTITTIN